MSSESSSSAQATSSALSKPSPTVSSNTRKAPPAPLSIPSSLSPQVSQGGPLVSDSTSPPERNSLDSSRTDLTSLRISDFPTPPSVLPFLPTIPASPRTPKSLYFSTTPTPATPRSQHSVFLQEPNGSPRSLVPSPRSIKGFFTRSNNSLVKLTDQQDLSPVNVTESSSSLQNKRLGDGNGVEPYPYILTTGFDGAERMYSPATRVETPVALSDTSGGNSGRSSPLLAPDNQPDVSSHGASPLRQQTFVTQHEEKSRARSPSLPPRSPLPIPPSKRSSFRSSARFSQIMRQVGPIDMDINEEQLLSTDFISEMLRQPGSSSSSSVEAMELVNRQPVSSSRQSRLIERQAEDPETISSSLRSNENPQSSNFASDVPSVLMPPEQKMEYPPSAHRVPSGLASSVFPSGGDVIIFNSPLASPAPVSPDSQSRERTFRGSSNLLPATPLTPDSLVGADSPDVPRSVLQQGSRPIKPSWRVSSMGQMIASRLPIGRGLANASGPTPKSPLASKVRQHRYPKAAVKQESMSESVQSDPSTILTSTVSPRTEEPAHPTPPVSPQTLEYAIDGNKEKDDRRETLLSAKSQATSTWTNRDSLAPPTIRSEDRNSESNDGSRFSYISQGRSNYSRDSNIYASSEYEKSTVEVGEIQVARKVEGTTTADVAINRVNSTGRSVVGIAPAVVIRHKNAPPTDKATSPTSNTASITSYELQLPPQQTDVVSPPPLSPKPPSHHTEVPESAKSITFQDDAPDGKHEYMSHKSVGETYWTIYPNALGSESVREPGLSQKTSPRATSFKSIISYISSKSKSGSFTTKATRASHSNSSRWAWLMRKPLPPLPPQGQDMDDGDRDDKYDVLGKDNDLSYLPVHKRTLKAAGGADYHMSRISLPISSKPQGWEGPTNNEKLAADPGMSRNKAAVHSGGAMFEMLGNDSLKIARNQSRRKPNTAETVSGSRYQDFSGHDAGPVGYRGGTGGRGRGGRGPSSFRSSLRDRLRSRWLWGIMIAVAVILIILIAVLATKLRNKKASNPTCTDGKVGALCNLDATCVCPTGSSGTCSAPLAKALNDLVPSTSTLFNTNITAISLATVLWETLGTPVNNDCSVQALLVDVGSVLNKNEFPNRTQWAQSALLWNLFETGDINGTLSLQAAIKTMPFDMLKQDGQIIDPSARFSTLSAGYLFDFANQSVTPQAVSFKNDASPSANQLAELNGVTSAALDRMYSFASASSTQRQNALSTYWRAILQLDAADLPTFLRAFKASPILLPFDPTSSPGGQSISALLSGAINKTLSFPIPVSCFPGLTASQLDRINAVEGSAFALDIIQSGASKFDTTCFPNRPVYGIMDVLRLRLSFADGREGVAQQAAILNNDASVRAILHTGELLAALPGPSNTNLTDSSVDPRRFGTLSHINHIALKWLQSFSDPTLAASAARYLLTSPSVPPPSSSNLFNAIIPTVEVAVFGNIFLSDISSFISSFSTPSGSLFFGSSQGQAFRLWALQNTSTKIAWANTSFASEVVHESASPNADFESVWNASGGLIKTGPTNASTINIVLNALGGRNLFSP